MMIKKEQKLFEKIMEDMNDHKNWKIDYEYPFYIPILTHNNKIFKIVPRHIYKRNYYEMLIVMNDNDSCEINMSRYEKNVLLKRLIYY
jgi:hypothetical protein